MPFTRWVRIAFGLVLGALAGLVIYWAESLQEPGLLILAGAVGGAVSAVVIQFYGNSIRLTDITITVPQFSEMHFAITKDSQQVAWKLFVESVTRISTQPLSAEHGILREALTSLYSLFGTTREILKLTQPSTKTGRDPTVEHLAIAMLNNELRPFLSRWHPALLDWEAEHAGQAEAEWPQGMECRAELTALQRRLEDYVLGFGRLARVPNAKEVLEGTLGYRFSGPEASEVPQSPPSSPPPSVSRAQDVR